MKVHEREVASTFKLGKPACHIKKVSVLQQLQRFGALEREKNRAAIKSLVRSTHFLTHRHIAHSTNFTQLIDLVLSCRARESQNFLRKCL